MAPIVIMTTTQTLDDATSLADAAVNKRLAACVQIIGPLTSVYEWQGSLERSHEYRCEFKTLEEKAPALREMIVANHPYELPELIAVRLCDISTDYRTWMEAQLADEQSESDSQ